MNVHAINPLTDARWAALQQRHPKASVFHTPGWLEALQRTYGYQPVVFTTSPPGAELENGLAFCNIKTWPTRRRLVSLPFTDHCSPLVRDSDELRSLLLPVKGGLPQEGWQYIEVRPTDSQLESPAGFDETETFCLHRLDLRPGLADLFSKFHKDCVQRKIQRAERESLSYEAGRSEALLKKFYGLLLLTRRRQGLPPQPIEWFRNLIACLGDAVTIRVASKNAHPVASMLTLRHRQVMVYKYGCSDRRFHTLGGTQFLFWKAIQEAKNDQLEELELGRSDMGNSGLVTFKDRWNATQSKLTYWRYPAPRHTHSHWGWAARAANQMLTHMPDRFLATAGRLLYKHAG